MSSSTIITAIAEPGVSSFTSFGYRNRPPLLNKVRNLSCKTSTPTIMQLSINSLPLTHKVPSQTNSTITSLEQLKIRSQKVLLNSSDSLRTLELIDTIQRLGIEHHFEEEINLQLGRVGDCNNAKDLFATSLQFRLPRHNDVFNNFLDKSGNFKESVTRDIWGMLSLYEASYFGAQGEEVLQHAMEFSMAHLAPITTTPKSLRRKMDRLTRSLSNRSKMVQQEICSRFGEYLDNGVISSRSCLALVHATFLIGDNLSKETISMMSPYPRLFSCSEKFLGFGTT
ncbi:hypothetical protein ACSQ67_010589 [Phaseolus vulgaris]